MKGKQQDFRTEKYIRYGIRKYSFGAASVAIAAGLMFLGNGAVSATEVQSAATTVAATETSTSTVATPATEQPTAPAVEQPTAPAETPKVEEAPVTKADTSKLEAAIARMETALGKAGVSEKTASAIEAAKTELAKAQALLSNDKATQTEVDKVAKELNSQAFVLSSMPKAEKKEENQNQDSRNGQAIPGNGESGFREASANTTVTNDVITPTTPAKPTAKDIIGSTSTVSRENFTGWDTYTMPFGSRHPGQGDLGVNTPEKIADAADLEFRVFSDQRAGTRPSPGPSNWTYDGKESDVKARIDYGLKLPAEEVQKIIEEAVLWRGKIRYDGSRIQSAPASTYFGSGPYEYLLSSIYKLGYEQGIDKVYVKDASKRIEVTEKAKAAGWTVSDFTVSNMPGGLVYDKQSDSIQGVVTHSSPFNYQQLKASVTFKNTITGKSVTVLLDNHRYGGTAWKDTTPPELKIDDTVKEGKVGENLVAPVEYKDAGASHAGAPNGRNISYNLTDENGTPLNRTATIRDTVGRAIIGVSGENITGTTGAGAGNPTELTGNDTKIPGVGFTIASNDMTDNNPNGFKGTPTEAGIYRVSIYARDYNVTNANEAYAHATFKISPTVTVKNVHAYDKEVPITISKGASEATITLPDGTNTKVVAKNGKWIVSETTNTAVNVNDEIGTVGETFNLKVLPTATANAATDTINVTASSENVTATFTRAEVTLKTKLGENVTATFNKTTGRWDLPSDIAEKKTVNSDGTTTWLKRDLYVDVNKDGETTFNVYEYTRTLDATGKVTAVNDVSRTLTTYHKENAANSSAESATDTNKGMVVTVKYDKGTNTWSADDNSTVTATKNGETWNVSTTSGFTGTVDAVHAESSDKASVLNDAPDVTSTSYTTVKGATVDLVKQASAAVTITDREDDATTDPTKKETTVTKVTLTSPSGKVTEYHSAAEVAAVKLTEVGNYTVKVDVKDSNGNVVTADSDTATGTNEGDNTAIASTTYVITVKNQATSKLYTVEDDTVTSDQLKDKVNPTAVDGFTPTKNDITNIPATSGKAGQTLPTPATVTYTKGTETISVETTVDVVVLPKVTPTGVTVLKDSTDLETVVKEKAKEAAKAIATDKIPTGIKVSIKQVKEGTLPATTTTGVQTPAKVVVEYKDANDNVVETREVEVPVTVVGSTVNKIVKLEGDELTDDEVKAAVTAGTDGKKGEPLLSENITAEPGTKEVPIPVTYNNDSLSERVLVPVVVLPKATGDVDVPKGSTVEKVKEAAKAKATELVTSADFKDNLPEGSKDVVVGDVTEEVLATMTAEKGTDKGIVKVPVTYTVDGKTYTRDAEITVNVLGSVPKTVYTVEGTKPDANKVKEAVTPDADGTVVTPTEADLPETTGKVGAKDVTVPTTVTYPSGNEIVKVPVTVLPKATPEKVTTLKDTTGENLTTAVKEKAQAALGKLTLPSGVTAELVPNQNYAVPATDSNGDKGNVPVKVQYKDATGTVVAEDTINVPVTVVSSTPKPLVVFEGEAVEAKTVQDAVTPGTDGTKGNPVIPEDLTKTTGKKEVTVPVTYEGIKDPEQVKVPVTVLPKPEADEILVAKNSDKEKAKEKVLAKAKKAIEDTTFKGKLPQGVTVEIDNTVPVTIPELTDDTEVEVTVKYTVPGQDKPLTTTVKVPVTVVEGVPQIVPVDENNKQPNPENSIDKTEYPEGSTFEYDPNTPVNTTTPGDYKVNVIVKDKEGNSIAEVPATVRVVESYPQFVPVDKDKKQPSAEGSIDPKAFPKGTEFTYETPVDTTTPGEKDVVVVAKIGDKVTKVPAKVMVVEPKIQYVPVDKSNKQPDASKSIDPEQYPDEITFGYKTPVDTTTPGEKDVVVVAKDGDDTLVEVPAKVKVVEGKEQLIPINATGENQPKPKDSITPSDYPADSTFEYKVPEGQTTPYDGTTPGDKPVTVVVKDKNGNVLVEVPATIKVVEAKPKPIETPVTNTPLTKDDISKYVKVPEKGKVTNVENIPDLTTPGKKDPVKVTVELPNGKVITVEVPVNVTPVKEIETPVTNTPLTKDDISKYVKVPEGGKVTNVENIPDLTTPGKKDPVKVTVELPNGKVITVEVPVNVTPVKEIETPVTTTPLTPEDYTKGITIPEGGKVTNVENIPDLTTPGKKDPVKVTVTLPNGKVITVEVPVNVTPVKEIETPVTKTPLTPEDYTKGIKIPEGGKVTNVENIPDLTTPGKKDPVKVTVELPNGKVVTVEVPVNVTPITPIETPVTKTPLTPEDYTKGITIPEGGKVTNVENIPDLTTPGKKDPVKVTVTLPNGKVITVEVPVNVTPVKEIETPVTKTPLTPEDYTKGIKIPEGGKVTKVENIPDLTTPGKKDPVKVTITLPNGKVVTVDVPVTVTPVKEIETPVTNTPLTKDDISKYVKVPEGGKVTNVENIPDLTTPGKKDPVKVTVELPNGKVITVEVPVNVTPITPIETPVTTAKLTPEDILKQIKVPEGATTKVENIPDLTTPGKKDPVKVTITLPNGKVVTVEIPVNVTPIEDIVKKQGDPITAEDVEKHIPKGVKVINIGDKPTTDIPGERPSIPVVIELPNGIRVTMNIPVIVTPKVTPVVVPVGTPVTPEDVQKHIESPNGWKVTKVGEIPTTETPGTKPVVPVEIELPDGRKITVDVPVIVTPTVRQIVVPQGTPITPDDVKGHIDLPKEPGWEIVEVGEIPTTIPAGVKPGVKVKIKVPTGEIVQVEVPIIVTPKVTPIVVEVGTPITKEDVIKKVGLPEGWEIVEVGEIPTTETPGTKPVVKVKVKLPDGRIITVEVPVTVMPKSQNGGGVISQNGDSTVQIVTEYLDENGNRITSDKEGKHSPIELEGYEFSHSTTDAKGNILHHYKKVTKPINQEQPSSPETPTSPEKPVATPVQTSSTDSKPVAVETAGAHDKKELPNTGTEANASLAALGLLGVLGGFGLLARKKKED